MLRDIGQQWVIQTSLPGKFDQFNTNINLIISNTPLNVFVKLEHLGINMAVGNIVVAMGLKWFLICFVLLIMHIVSRFWE